MIDVQYIPVVSTGLVRDEPQLIQLNISARQVFCHSRVV